MHDKSMTNNSDDFIKKRQSIVQESRGALLFRIVRLITLALTFLLPVKFVTFMSTPESVPLYRFDIISLLVITWPVTLFEMMSGINLFFTVMLFLRKSKQNIKKTYFVYAVLWLFLALASLLGLVNASAPVYADQMLPYIFSMTAYVLTICLLCDYDEKSLYLLKTAFLLGACFAVYAGLHQHFVGFQELRDYMERQSSEFGQNIINEQFAIRLKEARVQGDFASCNTYGAFLAALLPFAVICFWRFGNEHVSPPILSRRIFSAIGVGTIGFTLYLTGSRGALIALLIGIGFLTICLPMKQKLRMVLIIGMFFLVTLLLVVIVTTGRGGGSLAVRLDYWQASIRMLLHHPLFGTGWGDFFHDYGQLRFWLDKESPHTPHNMIFLFASQCGVAGLLSVCSILFYPLYFAVHSVGRMKFSLKNSLMWYRLSDPLTFFILVVGAQFDLGFETPAYTAMLILFSIAVMSGNADCISYSFCFRKCASAVMLILSFVTIAISVRQFRAEYTAAMLNEELDPRYSQSHPITYISNMERIHSLLKRAVNADSHSPFLWASSAKYAFRLGNQYTAMQWMNEAIRRSPERSSFYLDRARMRYFTNGQICDSECREDLAKVRELSPKNPDFSVSDEYLLNPTTNH